MQATKDRKLGIPIRSVVFVEPHKSSSMERFNKLCAFLKEMKELERKEWLKQIGEDM